MTAPRQKISVYLRDRNPAMAKAWEHHFKGIPDVEVSCGDIFDVTADAIVSPANSFGFMDGGIDLVYSRHFGHDLQERLQEVLRREYHGELPVGEALIVETHDAAIPFLISAPTMRVPMNVSETVNAYLAFRAALRAVIRHNATASKPIQTVLCPGLGTAVGAMPVNRCAQQMHMAYSVVVLEQIMRPTNLGQALDSHYGLVR
jgi:O-acetyl-ADP-ribose deacetylase (regulator of RNase III)